MSVLLMSARAGAWMRDAAGFTGGSRPLAFEANRGQTDGQVKFLARGAGYTVFLTPTGAVLALGRDRPAVVRLTPSGANPTARIVGDGELAQVVNYARTPSVSAPTYGRVTYVDVYPGVDLAYYGGSQGLEYDFIVAPGARPDRIALAVDGAERLEVDPGGVLVARTAAGELRQPRPVAYQDIDGGRRRVDADYAIDGEGRVRIRLGRYDASRTLVIDPVLSFSTYLGGSDDEADFYHGAVTGIALDAAGNVYVTGTTRSVDFPTTPGAIRALTGDQDAFVTKLSPSGAVLYSTYVGGDCDDIGQAIAVDRAGNAYITGRAQAGFCGYDSTPGVLVAKLDPTGALVYARILAGSYVDTSVGQSIAVNAVGEVYVTGTTSSDSRDFPVTPGAFQTTDCDDVWNGSADGFVVKLNATGTALVFSTLLCGNGNDSPSGIVLDAAGTVYVAGTTTSTNFPTVGALQPASRSADGGTGFVSKLSPDGAHLVYSTYLGGTGADSIGGIALDAAGNAYVTGETVSVDFPTTPGVVQEHAGYRLCVPTGPCSDAFVTKINPSGSAIVYSTYLFGELDEGGSGIAVDAGGNAYVVGTTSSRFFPVLDAFQPKRGGIFDAFVTKLSPDGARIVYSSFLGGGQAAGSLVTGWNEGYAIALDPAGGAYVTGFTQAADFPTTPGAFQPHLGGGGCDALGLACRDAFVARVAPGGPGVVPAIRLEVTPADVAPGGSLTATWSGMPAPTAEDKLALYPLGVSDPLGVSHEMTWPTPGTAGGTLTLTPPADLSPGTYELRLLTPDPEYFNQPTAIARSVPIRIGGSATTTTPAAPSPCMTARCSLEEAIAGPACAGQPMPSRVTMKLSQAASLIEAAGTSSPKQARKLLKRARKLLTRAEACANRAARGKKPAISPACAAALRGAAERVLASVAL